MYANNTLSKVMNDVVMNAVSEIRRCYSRKIVDILAKVTKKSIDEIRQKFNTDAGK